MTTATTRRTTRLTQLSLLIALLAVLGFTPLGFIMIPPVSITLMHIPVIIGAILLGPLDGAILGGVFGCISLFKAVTTPGGPRRARQLADHVPGPPYPVGGDRGARIQSRPTRRYAP